MKRRLLVLVLLCAPVAVAAQSAYYAFEQITVAGTAIGFTTATISQGNGHAQANKAVCRLETAQIRFRVDGTAPTSSVGTLLEVGDILTLTDPVEMQQFKAIRTGSTSGLLDCSYRN